jgi:hypothetical protein
MGFIKTAIGAVIHPFMIDFPVWCVKLDNGKFLSERDMVWDEMQREQGARGLHLFSTPNRRPYDWTKDLVSSGDNLKVRELWMICPPNPISPLGNTAKLLITEPGTAFTFKTRQLAIGSSDLQYHLIIGKVTDTTNGDCEYFVWDCVLQAMSTPMKNNVYDFQSWRPDVGRHGPLALDVLGLHLD